MTTYRSNTPKIHETNIKIVFFLCTGSLVHNLHITNNAVSTKKGLRPQMMADISNNDLTLWRMIENL